MPIYAETSDIAEIIDINPPAEDGWTKELTKASRDILSKIKAEFWPPRHISFFKEDNLDTDELVDITVYRALGWYICPALENYARGEDGKWARKAQHFQGLFKEEWNTIQQLPIYDFDEDGEFEDTERQGLIPKRIGRG